MHGGVGSPNADRKHVKEKKHTKHVHKHQVQRQTHRRYQRINQYRVVICVIQAEQVLLVISWLWFDSS
jgi:hypothetical protein